MRHSRVSEAQHRTGPPGPLHGVPLHPKHLQSLLTVNTNKQELVYDIYVINTVHKIKKKLQCGLPVLNVAGRNKESLSTPEVDHYLQSTKRALTKGRVWLSSTNTCLPALIQTAKSRLSLSNAQEVSTHWHVSNTGPPSCWRATYSRVPRHIKYSKEIFFLQLSFAVKN